MRNLIALPVIVLSVMLQSAVLSRVNLLSGIADLPLVMLAAWALQEQVESAWQWALATGILLAFVSGIFWLVPILSSLTIVALARVLQGRVWQAPLLAMFTVTFVGTIIVSLMSFVALRFSGISLPVGDVLGLVTLPCVLLNMLLAIPVYVVMRDLARWVYPAPEFE